MNQAISQGFIHTKQFKLALVVLLIAGISAVWIAFNNTSNTSQPKIANPTSIDYSHLKREAARQATGANRQQSDERDYYRSALRLLHRVNDIHTRL